MTKAALKEVPKLIIPGGDDDDTPDLSFETVTPELAEEWLKLNIKNRSLSGVTIAKYKRDMLSGNWRVSADPIRFNKLGQLIDGQHRLRACAESGANFSTLVARNLDLDVVNVIDSGRTRKAADMLALKGYGKAFLLASAARWLMVIRGGMMSTSGNRSVLKPSHDEILAVITKHPLLEESCRKCGKPLGTTPSLLSALHYVAHNHLEGKADLADAFANVFIKGEPYYSKDDPALRLREQNMRDANRGFRATQKHQFSNIVYVWNAFSKGQAIYIMKPPEFVSIEGLRPGVI